MNFTVNKNTTDFTYFFYSSGPFFDFVNFFKDNKNAVLDHTLSLQKTVDNHSSFGIAALSMRIHFHSTITTIGNKLNCSYRDRERGREQNADRNIHLAQANCVCVLCRVKAKVYNNVIQHPNTVWSSAAVYSERSSRRGLVIIVYLFDPCVRSSVSSCSCICMCNLFGLRVYR